MMRASHARLVTAALVLRSVPAVADDVVLDLDATLARAATAAPAAVAARARIGEAEAARAGAGVVLPTNPELEVESGPRFEGERSTDLSVRIGQTFELGGRGAAREAIAAAGVIQARAGADAAVRDVQLAAALAYYDALHADRRVETEQRAAELADRAAEAAARRRKAGDVTDLAVDLARASAGRAHAAIRTAEAERAAAVGRLAALVAVAPDDTIVLRGDLRPGTALTLDALVPAVAHRADLRAAAAEADVAGAELRLARASRWPDLGLWIGYQREGAADLVLGGVRLTLPVWQRAQGDRATARAKATRVAAEVEVATRVASREVRDAFAAYDRARAAVDAFEADVLPALDDAEQLLTASLDAGQIDVGELLVARRELLDGQREYLDRLLAYARAWVTAQLVAGVQP